MATISQLKEKFLKAVTYIDSRPGVNEFVAWLETDTDFFTAPASTNFHSNFEGGLLFHSLSVMEFALVNFNYIAKIKPEYAYLKESVIICSLFHDVSKIHTYKKEEKFTKNKEGKWAKYMAYSVDDKFPMQHGPKSAHYISKFINLSEQEICAIVWHMGQSDCIQPDSLSKFAYNKAFENPLVKIIIGADTIATSIEETIDYKSHVS
jgi:HD superfamily phosphohydrolase YqeK